MKFYMVLKHFTHRVDCFCPGEKHIDFLSLKKGDFIEILEERRFVEDVGWFIQLVINDQHSVYVSLDDIQYYYQKEMIVTNLDLDLIINYTNYQVDQALDKNEKDLFLEAASRLREYTRLSEKYQNYIKRFKVSS